jgi:hypothetical protein
VGDSTHYWTWARSNCHCSWPYFVYEVIMRSETLKHAKDWDERKAGLVAAGMCHRCAARVAWHYEAEHDRCRAIAATDPLECPCTLDKWCFKRRVAHVLGKVVCRVGGLP